MFKKSRLSLILVAGLLPSFTPVFSQETLHSKKLESCESKWKSQKHQYDYSAFAEAGDFGNLGYQKFQKPLNRDKCKKPWSILVYMQADNNLTPYALLDLYEMEAGFVTQGAPKVGSTLRSDVLVQLDTSLSHEVRRLHMFQTREPYNHKITIEEFQKRTEKNIQSPVVERFDESTRHLSPAEDLEDFIRWGVRNYPAERYMVIVWGHGQGWTSRVLNSDEKVVPTLASLEKKFEEILPAVSPENSPSAESSVFKGRGFGGLAFDDSSHSFLNIPDLAKVLSKISKTELQGRPIDVYASDACLMQMLEVAYEVSANTRFVVGSTQIQNFLGLPYRRLLTELNTGYFGESKKAKADADEAYLAALMIPKVFRASMAPQGLQGRLDKKGVETVTMSTLNSGELRNFLVPSMLGLSQTLVDFLKEDPIRAVNIQFVIQKTPSFLGGAQDFGAFLTLLNHFVSEDALDRKKWTPASRSLSERIANLKSALQRTVSASILGTNYSKREDQLYLLGIRAVSVWLPSSPAEYEARRADVAQSLLAKQKSVNGLTWLSFIDELYGDEQ